MFFRVYSTLLNYGYHPRCWKQATGVILKKPGKPDYSLPKAYRVISLLNCLGKVSERILAQRLSYLAETTILLHPSQVGGRLKKSAIDAALLLVNEIEQNKLLGLKSTTLFLDVKGAFDHVARNQLLAILCRLGLPKSLVEWVASFLEDRLLKLSFNSLTEEFKTISTGIPQGSPISPILFLIYIRDLFSTRNSTTYISYVDDFSLTVASTSYSRNIYLLEKELGRLVELGLQNAISFDIAKTELCHWTRAKVAKPCTLLLPGGIVLEPKSLVKWLGVYFDGGLSFKEHVRIRASQARSAFDRMSRLANSERGLTPFALRQLYLACVVSVADYGSILWWRGQVGLIQPLEDIQNRAIRRILGVFRTAPIVPSELEAALPPPKTRLNSNIRQYAFRALQLGPNHPIRLEFTKLQTIFAEDEELASKFTKPIQIERIYSSIEGLVENSQIEPIQVFKYPPWKRQIPYQIRIDKGTKEEATTRHKLYLSTLKASTSTTTWSIYTDGSQIPGGLGVGVGLVAYRNQPRTPEYTKCWNLGSRQIVYNGELEGITRAVEYASIVAQLGDQVDIYSDNQAAILRLARISDRPGQACQIRCIEASSLVVAKGATITINWVPGHEDILGNERADTLAKEGTKRPPESDSPSFAFLGMKIQELKAQEWALVAQDYKDRIDKATPKNPESYANTYPWRYSKKLFLPIGVGRQIASAFYQLKTGHGYLKSLLFRIKRTTNNRCRCGLPETASHLLLKCPLYNLERSIVVESLRTRTLNLPLLLHTRVGIEKTLGFIQSTRVSTRKWHLARSEEEPP